MRFPRFLFMKLFPANSKPASGSPLQRSINRLFGAHEKCALRNMKHSLVFRLNERAVHLNVPRGGTSRVSRKQNSLFTLRLVIMWLITHVRSHCSEH